MDHPIDFVVTWVNDEDSEWRSRRARASGEAHSALADSSDIRFRDWGLLKYWFRAIESYCPWVRRVHLVTDTELPTWLATENTRLNIVDGRELKGRDVDTFSSRSVESQLHRIDGLAEQYVYFNDDFFVGRPLGREFFFRGGLPYGVNVPTILADGDFRAHAMLHASGLINRHFSRKDYLRTVAKRSLRVSSGAMLFRLPLFLACSSIPPVTDTHVGIPLLKSVVEQAYAAEPEAIEQARRTVFRSRNETAPIYYATMWHLATGKYFARSKSAIGKYFSLASSPLSDVIAAIEGQRHAQFCLNDGAVSDPASVRAQVIAAFERKLPNPSAFETT